MGHVTNEACPMTLSFPYFNQLHLKQLPLKARVRRGAVRPLLGAVALASLAACAPDTTDTATAELGESIDVRWTEHGIPHVTAQSWEGLGFGFAHSVAYDGVCVLARELVAVNGELSKYFEATEGNINSDAFHRAFNQCLIIHQIFGHGGDSYCMRAGTASRTFTEGVARLVEGLLLPGAPPNRACLIKQRGPSHYHWHL